MTKQETGVTLDGLKGGDGMCFLTNCSNFTGAITNGHCVSPLRHEHLEGKAEADSPVNAKALWSKCAGPGPRGALQSHSHSPGQALQKLRGLTAGGGSISLSWLRLCGPKATGKGVLRSPSAENRWWLSEPEQGWGQKPVLLEKMNHLGSETVLGGTGQDEACGKMVLSVAPDKLRLGKRMPQKAWWEQGQSAFTEVPRLKKRLEGGQAQDRECSGPAGQPGPQQLTLDIPRDLTGSTCVSVRPSGARREQRSAFSKPARGPAGRLGPACVFQAGERADALGELLGLMNTVDVTCWGRPSNSKLLLGDFWNLTVLPNAPLCGTFPGAPTPGLKHATVQTPTPPSPSSSSWALLPPTLTPLGLSAQNWCARCNLSFRLTSDLVFHMRSHHKKERAGPDLRPKRLRAGALTCPICHEYFRERHHLSRHMTSHS
ncbi:zinc finger protein 488 [Oryx dammah]|uniref:zinc finger protein 488 n=1 Tax=Oryx dammah TaxID=59534 RepID=UPI001A9BFD51|nr:zinc finger protein 488 [Oryx dammah]